MSEKKEGLNPRVITVIMGVIAILFSVFGFQQQSELKDATAELEKLRGMVAQTQNALTMTEGQAKIQRELAEVLKKQLEECMKNSPKTK